MQKVSTLLNYNFSRLTSKSLHVCSNNVFQHYVQNWGKSNIRAGLEQSDTYLHLEANISWSQEGRIAMQVYNEHYNGFLEISLQIIRLHTLNTQQYD